MNSPPELKTLSKDDWAYVERAVGTGFFGQVELVIDGYRVTLERKLVAKNRLGIMTYVNGVFLGKWCVEETDEARRFCFRKTFLLYKRSDLEYLRKFWGKKEFEKRGFKTESRGCYMPFWPSFRALKSGLLKNNKSIELIRPPSLTDSPEASTL